MSEPVSQAIDAYLRATKVVDAINGALPADVGLTPIPADYMLKALNREAPGAMLASAVEVLGGLPAFIAWAASDTRNQGKLYEWFVKQIPSESKVEHSGGLNIVSSLGDSVLDDTRLDEDGFVR